MKYITQATEGRLNRMIKGIEARYGKFATAYYKLTEAETEAIALAFILDEIKANAGCYGVTIKEAKQYGTQFESDCFFKGIKDTPYEAEIRGMNAKYDLVYYIGTHDLDTVYIYDFNALVSYVYNKYMNENCR